MKRILPMIVVLFSIMTTSVYAGEVALTIDDLPFVGSAKNDPGKLRREQNRFNAILMTLQQEHIPVTGFVIGGAIDQSWWPLLVNFHNAGNLIGNHTYSHPSLNRTGPAKYIKEIEATDVVLKPLMPQPKYFRYPFLATGRNHEDSQIVRDYLATHGYVIAPVSIDSKDFSFNEHFHRVPWQDRPRRMEEFRQRYINFVTTETIKAERNALKYEHRPIKHILLIHMNTLNSYFLPDIIKMFHDRGYTFITLPEALSDPYYKKEGIGR